MKGASGLDCTNQSSFLSSLDFFASRTLDHSTYALRAKFPHRHRYSIWLHAPRGMPPCLHAQLVKRRTQSLVPDELELSNVGSCSSKAAHKMRARITQGLSNLMRTDYAPSSKHSLRIHQCAMQSFASCELQGTMCFRGEGMDLMWMVCLRTRSVSDAYRLTRYL